MMNAAPNSQGTLVVASNSCWNLVNFRAAILRQLVLEGFRVIAIAPLDESVVELARIGVEADSIAMNPRGLSPVDDVMLLIDYRRRLRRLRPSAFLPFTAKPNIYGSIAAASQNVPVINTITGLGTAFLSGWALQKLVLLLYRLALRRSRRVFFHNEEDRAFFVRLGLVRSANASVVAGSGVNLEKFSLVASEGRGSGPAIFLFIGRMLRDKGIAEFAEAAAVVKASRIAKFQVVGALDEHPKAISRELADQWEREGTVQLFGATNDVASFIAAADCVVLPSYREGLPRVLLEASAMGKPVIATDVPGCRQAVENGVTGLLCDARSGQSLAKAMLAFLDMTEDQRANMGRRGRAKAEGEFSEQAVVSAYVQAVLQLQRASSG